MNDVSTQTQQYWLDTVLAWAEARLMPPQFDECKQALMQLAAAQADAATLRGLLERGWAIAPRSTEKLAAWKDEVRAVLADAQPGGAAADETGESDE